MDCSGSAPVTPPPSPSYPAFTPGPLIAGSLPWSQMNHAHHWLLVATVLLCGCGGIDKSSEPDADTQNGCPSLTESQAMPGDPIDGDTYATFAAGFFSQHCTRCHASTLTGPARDGAPVGFDWDLESSVRAHLPQIRIAVGVLNFMPAAPPDPTCDERQRIVRWIDADAP